MCPGRMLVREMPIEKTDRPTIPADDSIIVAEGHCHATLPLVPESRSRKAELQGPAFRENSTRHAVM